MSSIEWEQIHCIMCGAGEVQPYLSVLSERAGQLELVECSNCHLVYMNPRPTAAAMRPLYPDDYYAYDRRPRSRYQRLRWWFFQTIARTQSGHNSPGPPATATRSPVGLIKRFLTRPVTSMVPNIPPQTSGRRLLDVGCGRGDYLLFMRELGWETHGVDISSVAAKVAREDHGLDVVAGTLESCRFPAGSFDVVTMWHVLEHIHDPQAALTEAKRILQPGGYLGLAFPLISSPIARLFSRHWNGISAPHHLFFFTRPSITQILEQHGFGVEIMATYSSPHGLTVDFIHVLSEWTGISRHTLYRVFRPFALLSLPLVLVAQALGWGDAAVLWAKVVSADAQAQGSAVIHSQLASKGT